jgi:hypothetical protein
VRLAFAGLILLAACASSNVAPVETVVVDGQSLTFRYTPTGDNVPYDAVLAIEVNADGTTTGGGYARLFDDVTYPTVRIGGTQDRFVALDAFYARCLPGETYDRADFGDEGFTFDERTGEFIFSYDCRVISGE